MNEKTKSAAELTDLRPEGRKHRKRLTEQEVREAASRLEARGIRPSVESLMAEIGRGSIEYLHKMQRIIRHEGLESLARAELEGDLADPVMIARDGSSIVFQVPVAITITQDQIEQIMQATPGELQLGDANVLMRKGTLDVLQTGLKKFSKTT